MQLLILGNSYEKEGLEPKIKRYINISGNHLNIIAMIRACIVFVLIAAVIVAQTDNMGENDLHMQEETIETPAVFDRDIGRLLFLPNGGNNTNTRQAILYSSMVYGLTLRQVVEYASIQLEYVTRPEHSVEHFRVFNGEGLRVISSAQVTVNDTLYVVPTGDHFFWPGVRVGHRVLLPPLQHMGYRQGVRLHLETLSMRPRAFLVPGFLTEMEAQIIQMMGNKQLKDSGVFVNNTVEMSKVRDSQQAWLKSGAGMELIDDVTARIHELVRIDPTLRVIEDMQVVHYKTAGHYDAHYDYFPPAQHPTRVDLRAGRNRMITVLFYLNTVPDGGGGHTNFPLTVRPNRQPIDYHSCALGLKVQPRQGDAVVFYSLLAEGHMQDAGGGSALDRLSLHGGCPVLDNGDAKAEKWIANNWLYNRAWDGAETQE